MVNASNILEDALIEKLHNHRHSLKIILLNKGNRLEPKFIKDDIVK